MQEEVHCSDTQHRWVSIVAIDKRRLDMLHRFCRIECPLVMLLDILHCLHQEARTTHRRVADKVVRRRLHHIHNHTDNVTRRTKLSVRSRSSHLTEDILIDIAHRITVVHVEGIDPIDHLRQCTSIRDKEGSRLHIPAVSTLLTCSDGFDKLKDILTNHLKHVFWTRMAEHRPAHTLVGNLLFGSRIQPVLPNKEGRILYFGIKVACHIFLL